MPDFSTYDRRGLRFHYPSNWDLEDGMESGEGAVLLTGPTGAFWIFRRYPSGTDPERLAENVLADLRTDYPNLEHEATQRKLFGRTLIGYEMHFFYLDLSNTAMVLTFAEPNSTYAVFWQAGDQLIVTGREEGVAVEDVFEAITHSLLQNLA